MRRALRLPGAAPKLRLGRFVPARSFASQTPGVPRFQVFNRRAKWLQKERAASNPEAGRLADYLKDEVATRLCERLLVSRHTAAFLTPSPTSCSF
jgi:NADH dehydrogenase [ubiquinone] 1 alpha subcomplex assembly factor 5